MTSKLFQLLIVVLLLCSCDTWETPESFYPTYSEAVAKEAVKKGWMPSIIPASSHQIYEKHHLDTNATILAFQYPQGLNAVLTQTCQQSNVSNVQWPIISASWWPSDLTGSSKFSTPRFIFYQCTEYNGYFAVNAEDTTGYFWRNKAF